MRRCLARVLACLCAAAIAMSSATVATAGPVATAVPTSADTGAGGHGAAPMARRDASLEMRDLFLAADELTFFAAARARMLLARPTDGPADPGGDGYRRRSVRTCGDHVCVHHVRRGADAPPDRRWADRTLRVMEKVWRHEVDRLGFRRPPSDRRRGGDRRFDVYLTDLGERGLFGYCSPERRAKGQRFTASSYCVLDNDFARSQYGAAPRRSLRVTAAHEFFHAIQFGYDFREDPWLMETTAVWVEESFADGANDSRRYLRFGNVRRPAVPLDTYSNTGLAQYGNWPFWEFATARHGKDLVRAVWRRADARRGARDQSSVRALAAALDARSGDRGALRRVLAAYAAANLDPARAYPEGEHWPVARVRSRERVGRTGEDGRWRPRVDHLAATHLALRPPTRPSGSAAPRTRRWRLRLDLTVPARGAVVITVTDRHGRQQRRTVLERRRRVRVDFDGRRVSSVVVTAVNASARYRCGRSTMWACGGVPRDDGARFDVRYRAVRRAR